MAANTRDTFRQVANIASLGMTLTVNALANALPINGRTTGEISDSFANFFVPAGYVFSIWGLIYLALIAFVVYQALPSQKENERLRRIGPWFVVSNFANSSWIFAWHFGQVALSMLIMLVLLGSLLVIYTRLDRDRSDVRGAQRWLVNLPFSLYLGWITVATAVNASVTLLSLGWNGAGIPAEVWSVALLVIATAIGAAVALPRRDWVYAAVLTWAFAGIAFKFAGLPLIAYGAGLAATVALVIGAFGLVRSLPRQSVKHTAQRA